MKRPYALFCLFLFAISNNLSAQVTGSRMNEVFLKSTLSPATPTAGFLTTPWEITYGPDDYLWITDAKTYKVWRMDPNSGAKTQILDLSEGSAWPASLKRNFASGANPWPQGGLAGLAIHPDFMNTSSPKKYVYISYVHTYDSTSVLTNGGSFFTNSVVRFTYTAGQLISPVVICDTIPGSVDHNSQRMIIAPVGGTSYLFYAAGDMGAGQLASRARINHAQNINKYEGKILRFNLEPDGDAGTMDSWIPNSNPFNGAKQSAVWCLGMRNNQGFAYDSVRNILYGSSHGPYSDDEVNIIEPSKNYGHPLVIGYASDNNYVNASAGANSGSSLSIITSEVAAAAAIGASYKDPLFSGYARSQYVIDSIFTNNPTNASWPSEAWSGLGLYNYSIIPGWKNSLLMAGLKWGRLVRTKLDANGTAIAQIGGKDTVCVFDGLPRYRDMAFGPNGKDIYITMEGNSTVAPAAPSINNPSLTSCNGCIQKFTFLGYAPNGTTSSISQFVPIATGVPAVCEDANTITVDNNNKNLWIPITDTSGNIVAEIYPNGNFLGDVTASLYTNAGAVREEPTSHMLYLDRNITITPQNPTINPANPVGVRLYLNNAEFTALSTAVNSLSQPSNVTYPADMTIFKNSDPCSSTLTSAATPMATSNQAVFGSGGYAVQTNVTSFSTFYIASINYILPLHLLSFKGAISNDIAILKWITEGTNDDKNFIVERSLNGRDFYPIGTLAPNKNVGQQSYSLNDDSLGKLAATVVYYRLKTTGPDDKYSYSSVVTLYPDSKRVMSVHPNPVINDVTIDIKATVAEQAIWKLTDVSGKTVLQHSASLIPGKNTITISLAKIPAGTYFLKLSGNNINQAVKLQKL